MNTIEPVPTFPARSLAYGHPVRRFGGHPVPGPELSGDVHVRRIVLQSFRPPSSKKDYWHFKLAKLVIKWGSGSAAIQLATLRLNLPRGVCNDFNAALRFGFSCTFNVKVGRMASRLCGCPL